MPECRNKRNYHQLQNLNFLKINNENLIRDLNNLIKNDKISEIFEFSFDNFYNEKGEKYIGEMKNGLKDGKEYFIMNIIEQDMKAILKMINQIERGNVLE